MAVGGDFGIGEAHAELYNFENDSWKQTSDYPFAHGYSFSKYEMVFIPETSAFLVIGGFAGQVRTNIARYEDDEWSDAGELQQLRLVSFFLVFVSYKIKKY